jgi:hypothetical protein
MIQANLGRCIMSTVKLSRLLALSLPLSLLSSAVLAQVAVVPDAVPAEQRAALAKDPNWQVPRTSWGHPNLEGNYSTDDMRSVPRERPEEFGTRAELSAEEFAERAERDAEQRDQILNRSSYSARSVGSRTFGWTSQGPFDTFEDFHNYDRCLTRGILGSAFATIYGNGMKIAQSPETVVISYEMLPDTRIIYLDGRPRATRAATGRAIRWSSKRKGSRVKRAWARAARSTAWITG